MKILLIILLALPFWMNAQEDKPYYTSLEEALEVPDKVYILDLSNQDLEELPTTIGTFKNLKLLYLDRNKLSKLPEEIGNLKNLHFLNLNYNELEEVPKSISKLKKLHSLGLSRNKLKAFPNITKLQKLEILNLSVNKIKQLPEDIGNMQGLRQLYLNHNPLKNFPEGMGELQDLSFLNITSTYNNLPPVLLQLQELDSLYWMWGDINAKSKEIFQKCFPNVKLGPPSRPVSPDIINAFFQLEEKNEHTEEEALHKRRLDLKKNKPELAPKILDLITYTMKYDSYIDELIEELITATGGKDDDGKILGERDKDTPTRILITEGKGDELEERTKELSLRMDQIIDNEPIASEILMPITEQLETGHGEENWAESRFKQMPLAAILSQLTLMKENAKKAELEILEYWENQ